MAQLILMIEGADGAGKTTLAKALADLMEIAYFKPSVHGFLEKKETRLITANGGLALAHFLKQTGQSVIFDRNYPSEWVYGQLLSNWQNYGALAELDRLYASMGAVIVLCEREDYSTYQDHDFTTDQLITARLMYRDYLRKSACTVIEAPAMTGDIYERAYATMERIARHSL